LKRSASSWESSSPGTVLRGGKEKRQRNCFIWKIDVASGIERNWHACTQRVEQQHLRLHRFLKNPRQIHVCCFYRNHFQLMSVIIDNQKLARDIPWPMRKSLSVNTIPKSPSLSGLRMVTLPSITSLRRGTLACVKTFLRRAVA
jgi:hypothetical protein